MESNVAIHKGIPVTVSDRNHVGGIDNSRNRNFGTGCTAQRKASTAARSDARTTHELAEKVRADPVERASFDPFFTFFLGGVAVFEGEERVGAVGVSGLPGEVDEQLALAAIERSAGP